MHLAARGHLTWRWRLQETENEYGVSTTRVLYKIHRGRTRSTVWSLDCQRTVNSSHMFFVCEEAKKAEAWRQWLVAVRVTRHQDHRLVMSTRCHVDIKQKWAMTSINDQWPRSYTMLWVPLQNIQTLFIVHLVRKSQEPKERSVQNTFAFPKYVLYRVARSHSYQWSLRAWWKSPRRSIWFPRSSTLHTIPHKFRRV